MADKEKDFRDEIRDELPEDLNVSAFVGPYKFPDNSRRRIPAVIYMCLAAVSVLLWFLKGSSESGLVSRGFLGAAVLLALVGAFSLSASWRMTVDEKLALVHATRAVGFAVGH
ncbi:MAG: hypothetical protein ACKPAJ_10120, partial [Actinomycetota bacterium]